MNKCGLSGWVMVGYFIEASTCAGPGSVKKDFEECRCAFNKSAFLTVIYLAIEYYCIGLACTVVGGVRRNKGEAGYYVLQLGAASHCGVGSPQHKLFWLFMIFFVYHLFICFLLFFVAIIYDQCLLIGVVLCLSSTF